MSFANVAISQQLSFPQDDAKRLLRLDIESDIDRRELELRKEQDALKDQRIANLEKELALAKQEIVLKDKMLEIKDMEILATRRALVDMTQVADRAIKLAETSKPKSNWELLGLAAVVLFVAGLVVGGL